MKNLSFKKYQNYAKEKEQVHQWPHRPLRHIWATQHNLSEKKGTPEPIIYWEKT